MNTKVFENLTMGRVIDKLNAMANGYAEMFDSPVIRRDMNVVTDAIYEILYECGNKLYMPYYVAIREMGVENGQNIDQVKERCKILGKPVWVCKIEDANEKGIFSMTIHF